ncbi:MAG: CoA-binding protein [Oceanospirillaceae bacterium]|nr:CoA-binding protein [Oceanospirillaceae bacterium]
MAVSDQTIKTVLEQTRTIALIGASAKPERPSYRVLQFLLDKGYRVFPVNPGQAGTEILGQIVYASLGDIPKPVDMVEIFRRSEDVGPIVEQAIASGAKTVWMQLGVINQQAADTATAAGLTVIMDHCPAIEYPRLCD